MMTCPGCGSPHEHDCPYCGRAPAAKKAEPVCEDRVCGDGHHWVRDDKSLKMLCQSCGMVATDGSRLVNELWLSINDAHKEHGLQEIA